ncbi:DUF1015 domain-containing protein [bacterium SCSIO 12741]|nr:DUF1015 domain-containing protein [bacterium SCSIO 12741]
MAKITPFKAFRPPRNMVHLVASRSYVSYSRSGLAHKLNTNPYSFIHIINPEFGIKRKTKPNSNQRFENVAKKVQEFIDKGFFIRDNKDTFYLYRQSFHEHQFCGIIAGTSIDDYQNGVIKKHEHTLLKRETVFKTYLETTDINAEPVLMTHPDSANLEAIFERCMKERPEYEFLSSNGANHELWLIQNPEDIQTIQAEYNSFDSLYIADGHHRCASSNLLGQQKRQENPDYTGQEKYNYLMSYIIPESQLWIMEFNRMVEDLNGLSRDEFLDQVRDYFEVSEYKGKKFKPKGYNQIGMYLEGQWYALDAKIGTFDVNHPVEKLDVSILSNNLLDPILGISDLRTDKRVHFVAGDEPLVNMTRQVDSGKMKVAFCLHPITLKQLKEVADNHQYMPPKSTYIEPKIRSGLTLYRISE